MQQIGDFFKRFWVLIIGLGVFGAISFIADLQQIFSGLIPFIKNIFLWWSTVFPAQKILGPISKNENKVVIFVRDLFIAPGTPIFSRDGINGPRGLIPNVLELWPSVEGKSVAKLLNVFGQVGKKEKIEIIEMGQDSGIWDCNLIVIGAQTQKCFDFYQKMQEVAYRIGRNNIRNNITGRVIPRSSGYGYGIIIKCKNPFLGTKPGVGILLGGYGTLGTEAAVYYFAKNITGLGKEFSNKSFGVVVRASTTAGVQSTRRLRRYNKEFK